MNVHAKRLAYRILTELFKSELPDSLVLKIQQWFVCDMNREEKDAALEDIFNEMMRFKPDPPDRTFDPGNFARDKPSGKIPHVIPIPKKGIFYLIDLMKQENDKKPFFN